MTTLSAAQAERGLRHRAIDVFLRWPWYPIIVYLLTRLLFLAIAGVDSGFQHWSLQEELSNWDGYWYLRTTQLGYPHLIPTGYHAYSTLGFLPLQPMLMWLVAKLPFINVFGAGLAISLACGLGAVMQMSRLATRWWDEESSRRAILFFCMFPGTVVFSMVYSEGLTLLLVTTALIALEDRRWWVAGIAAGLSTAVAPISLAIIPACLAASARELHKRGWTNREALKSLVAPVLSPLGLVAFGIFLWAWVGTPFASYIAQNRAWEESSTPLAVPRIVGHLIGEVFGSGTVGRLGPGGFDLNALNGMLGAFLFIWGMYLIWRYRHRIDLTAIVWTCAVFVLTFTSNKTPPNARLLICAFPVLLAIGVYCRGKWRWIVLGIEFVLILVMTYFTYVGSWLRP